MSGEGEEEGGAGRLFNKPVGEDWYHSQFAGPGQAAILIKRNAGLTIRSYVLARAQLSVARGIIFNEELRPGAQRRYIVESPRPADEFRER